MSIDLAAVSAAIRALMNKRDEIEEEMRQLGDVLGQEGVEMDTPLVDEEGYPRNDIDITTVRRARARIRTLQHDYRCLMEEIEHNLHHLHQGAKATGNLETAALAIGEEQDEPFVLVDKVEPDSPAYSSGLRVGDRITKFATMRKENFTTLRDVQDIVMRNVGKIIRVSLLRDNKSVSLSLQPHVWAGRGVLGCNVVPIVS